VLGTLALGVSVLLWATGASGADEYNPANPADATYGAHPKYQGYGPVEDLLLTDQNPPVPTPIGRRILREYIPGAAEEMQKWPAFFRDMQMDLHLRTFYFNRDIPVLPRPPVGDDTVHQEAWAFGGWLGLQTGWLLNTFRAGTTGYFSLPVYAPDDRDGTGLLAPGQEGIAVFGQAFGQLRYQDYVLVTGGRQLVNQGFVNPQDNRMIPNTFTGVTATGTFGPVDYYAGYLTSMKQRNSDTFINMARAAGVTTGENRGVILTTLNVDLARTEALAPLSGFQVFLGNYLTPDVFNHFYLNPEYRRSLTDDWRVGFGVQYFDQRSVGDDLIGDFSASQVGSRFQLGWRGLTFLAMGSATWGDTGVRSPYGGWLGYISLAETDPNLANEKAWETGFTYDWGGTTFEKFKVPGLWTSLLYSESFGIQAVAQDVPVGKRREMNLFWVYRPPQVPGLQFRMLNKLIWQEGFGGTGYDMRLIVDFELPLL
jgi:hypothetical protein